MMTKLIYVLNLIVQFLMMNKFLGQNDPYWGVHILSDILTGTDWEHSGRSDSLCADSFLFKAYWITTLSSIENAFYAGSCLKSKTAVTD